MVYTPVRWMILWIMAGEDFANLDLIYHAYYFKYLFDQHILPVSSPHHRYARYFIDTPFDPFWRPNNPVGAQNPMVYQVFYGLAPDQGWPDQCNGRDWWAHPSQMHARFRTMVWKFWALARTVGASQEHLRLIEQAQRYLTTSIE